MSLCLIKHRNTKKHYELRHLMGPSWCSKIPHLTMPDNRTLILRSPSSVLTELSCIQVSVTKKKTARYSEFPARERERERETAVESSPVDTVGGSKVSQLVFVYDTRAVLASTQTSTASKLCRNLLKGNSLHVYPLSFVTSLLQLRSGIHNPLPFGFRNKILEPLQKHAGIHVTRPQNLNTKWSC